MQILYFPVLQQRVMNHRFWYIIWFVYVLQFSIKICIINRVCNWILVAVFLDKEAPVITGCPENIEQNTDSGKNTAVVYWTAPTITDNSGYTREVQATNSPGDTFSIGSAQVRYTVADWNWNSATPCSFYVVIKGKLWRSFKKSTLGFAHHPVIMQL